MYPLPSFTELEMTRTESILRWFSKTPVAMLMAAIYGLFTAFVLIPKSAEVKAYTKDAGSIDLSFGFNTPDRVYAMAEAYGEAGRNAYIFDRVSFDIAWPIRAWGVVAWTVERSVLRGVALP